MRFNKGLVRQIVVPIAGCLVLISGLVFSVSDLSEVSASPWQESVGLDLRETLSVLGVEPAIAPNDVDTEIHITGTGFADTPQVLLGESVLTDVSWLSETELIAVVPWGMAAGDYDLTVINPDEVSATWDNVFTVMDGFGEFITNGPYGGQAVQMALQPGNPSTVYGIMWEAGLFMSEDGGDNWAQIHDHNGGLQLDFDAEDPNILYFGSSELYRSMDNGQTWVNLKTIFQSMACSVCYPAAHPKNAGVVYSAMGSCGDWDLDEGQGGVYYSTNHGDEWKRFDYWELDEVQEDDDYNIKSLAVRADPDPNNENVTLIAGTYNGKILYSEDSGNTWQEGGQLGGTVNRIFINPDQTQLQIWAITRGNEPGVNLGEAKVYRSNDMKVWDEIEELDIFPGGGTSQAQMAFTDDSIWLASNHLYRFDFAGESWEEVEGVHSMPLAVTISPENSNVIYVGSDFGVHKSEDGGIEWIEKNQGLSALVPRDIAVSSQDPDTLFVKTHQGIFKSQDAGNSWQYLDYGAGGFPGGKGLMAVDPFDDNRIYLNNGCEGEFCIDISENGGWDWETIKAEVPEKYVEWKFETYAVTPSPHIRGRVVVGASFEDELLGVYEGVFYIGDYNDVSENWDFNYVDLPKTTEIDRITDIVFDAFDPDLLYAATHSTGLWRSENGGQTWESIPIEEMQPPIKIEDIAIHPDTADRAYIRASSTAETDNPEPELWVSDDRGETWQPITYVFLGVDLVVSPPTPGNLFYSLFTGCEAGLCRSYDMGQTWSPIEGVPRPEILSAVTDGERSILYMGTPGGLVNTAEEGTALSREDTIPGLGSISGGGVYRLTQRLGDITQIYLPMIGR